MRCFILIGCAWILPGPVPADLFVGLEGSAPATRSSDLSGFPNVTWSKHFAFDVSGAAARPDGSLLLCNGAFTTPSATRRATRSRSQIATRSRAK